MKGFKFYFGRHLGILSREIVTRFDFCFRKKMYSFSIDYRLEVEDRLESRMPVS